MQSSSGRPPRRRTFGEGGRPAVGFADEHDNIGDDPVGRLARTVAELQRTVRLQSSQITHLQETVRTQGDEIHTLQGEVRHLERWAVLAAPIPGWGEHEGFTVAMQEFLSNFKRQIVELCDGAWRGRIGFTAPDGCGPWFDYGILLPYWKELGEAMLRPGPADHVASSFHIKDIQLGKAVLDLLAPGLMTTYFRTLSFDNNRFGREGIKFVLDVVEHNPELESLVLTRNPIENRDDAHRLCDLIGYHPSLRRVVIEECGGWTPSDLLYPIITASDRLVSISLEACNLCTMGRTGIFDFLADNCHLECLNLKDNQLNDDDAMLIARALESNATLKWLDLEANNITSVGRDALFKTVFNPASLGSVASSNHTCGFNLKIDGAPELPSIINLKYGSPRLVLEMRLILPHTVRKMKLLTLLSAPYEKNVNIDLLDGVPLELMPEVLDFVQQYPDVAYEFPDGLNTQLHWGYMAALRPDTPQTERESAEGGEDEEGADSDGSVCTETAQQNEDSGDAYVNNNWSRHDDSDSEEEEILKRSQIKRLTMVYEITRGWRMETGEPLCAFATSRHILASLYLPRARAA